MFKMARPSASCPQSVQPCVSYAARQTAAPAALQQLAPMLPLQTSRFHRCAGGSGRAGAHLHVATLICCLPYNFKGIETSWYPHHAPYPVPVADLQEEPADLEGAYVAALADLAVGDFDSGAPRAYNRSFAAKAERQEGDTAGEGPRGWGAGFGGWGWGRVHRLLI